MLIPMSAMREGDKGVVHAVAVTGAVRRRLQDLGLICGTTVYCRQKSPSGSPTAYWMRDTLIALRQQDAEMITIQWEG